MKFPVSGLCLIALVLSSYTSVLFAAKTSDAEITQEKPDSILIRDYASREMLTGKWYGEQPLPNGGRRQHIIERNEFGQYRITFRVHEKSGQTTEQIEVGLWGVSGPVLFTIFQGLVEENRMTSVDPVDPHNYDAYKIIRLDAEKFVYQHYVSGNQYTVKRVPEDFEFPE